MLGSAIWTSVEIMLNSASRGLSLVRHSQRREGGVRIDLTVDLASPIDAADASGLVRLVGEPPDIGGRFVVVLDSGSARQVATALLAAADQADELDRDVSAPSRWGIR